MTQNIAQTGALSARGLTVGYGDRDVLRSLALDVEPGRVTAIVGANASGKSTLLRGLARIMRPKAGSVLLDGVDIARMPAAQLALRLGMLPQQPVAPEGISVADLVGRGRHPHQRWFRQWSPADQAAVAAAMHATGIGHLAHRPIDALSGGQRQRVWIALALAQDPDVLLLDEPTSFLDLSHQVDVLDLVASLGEERDRTVVLVLHDLNLACRYADRLIAMREGEVHASGAPSEVVTAETVREVFGLDCEVVPDPLTSSPLVLPAARHRRHR
ncbi:MAG: ABC transporter ATP-binding protein [Nocardiopsaceae bacterium]|nr:ABC transporter ATP-binding protein [Nocardiopsaceae bacterium]